MPPELPHLPGPPWERPSRPPALVPGVGVPATSRRGASVAFDGLLARRILFLRAPLDEQESSALAAELMTLDGVSDAPVTLLVNSAGGALPEAFTVIDVMRSMRAPVTTVALGQALGTAAAVVALGTGGREAVPNATISLRVEAQTTLTGSAVRIQREAEHLAALRDRLAELLADASALPLEMIRDDLDHGRPLDVQEALASRLIDRVRARGRP
jgi:ATP-dependent Clp protease, protease subunit